MRVEPERVERVKTYLSLIMGEEIAEEFSDFDMIISLLRQKSFSWQLADSLEYMQQSC